MIIDCHGHYTTAPRALHDWRARQVAAIRQPGQAPSPPALRISDAEIRQSPEDKQPPLMPERAQDPAVFTPPAHALGPPNRHLPV